METREKKINKRKRGAGMDRAPATQREVNSKNTTWRHYRLVNKHKEKWGRGTRMMKTAEAVVQNRGVEETILRN